ncbi:MAG: DUF4111 domain-containing protein, partial [Ilumatobacter sp.]|nr:DUF4111 domain-containing protein [Ilumatobacter sp.]
LYVVGSSALGDHRQHSDIDVIAFTADPTDAEVIEALESAHETARIELGADVVIDGPRLGWADVSVPPMPALRAWTLDGEFRFDGDCFVINPVSWYVLDRYGIAIRGAPSSELGVHVDAAEMQAYVREEVDTRWRTVGEQLRAALADPESTAFDAASVEWAALGVVRPLYVAMTGDVAPKTVAGEWAAEQLPEHAAILHAAIELRRHGVEGSVDRDAVEAVADLVDDVVAHITSAD